MLFLWRRQPIKTRLSPSEIPVSNPNPALPAVSFARLPNPDSQWAIIVKNADKQKNSNSAKQTAKTKLSTSCTARNIKHQFHHASTKDFAPILARANSNNKQRRVVVVRITASTLFTPDLVAAINFLIADAGDAAQNHVKLLVHYNPLRNILGGSTDKYLSKILSDNERVQIIKDSSIPRTYWRLCVLHTDFDLTSQFGKLYENWNQSGHLAFIWFMNRFPQYEFIWLVEDDVRIIGSWKDLFERVQEQTRIEYPSLKRGSLPDFVTFDEFKPPHDEWYWRNNCDHIWSDSTDLRSSLGVGME
ncbi:hypothetical protein HK100_004985 [Physocladia obscura]|uniref:Uncharacterized protein n=1 Tax=Physocladia obscura TaxID=109957 RepID=A0AAD5XFL5_9FUNG|nr:hypothetical protein HK100_004985 [Physocladia obscura]